MQIMQKSKTDIAINCFHRDGGMESYTLDLVRGLHAHGVEITVCATQASPTVPECNQMEIHHVNQQIIPKKLRPYFLARQLAYARRGRDVPLVACNPNDHADIFVCGDTHLDYLRNMGGRPGLLDRLAIHRNHGNYATVKSIMAHSHLMQRGLTALYGVPPEKIRVIHPPTGTARLHPAPDETAVVRTKCGFRDDEAVFLFPSTGHKRKGLDLLVDSFEHTDLPIKLAVAGSLLPRPMKNVVGLGFCTNMLELCRTVNFTVMVPLYEPFGLVNVEFVLCDTHVVLSDNMACTEVMNDEADFFFSHSRPETLAQTVTQAAALEQRGRHKVTDPMRALTYDPTLEHHIDQAVTVLEAV